MTGEGLPYLIHDIYFILLFTSLLLLTWWRARALSCTWLPHTTYSCALHTVGAQYLWEDWLIEWINGTITAHDGVSSTANLASPCSLTFYQLSRLTDKMQPPSLSYAHPRCPPLCHPLLTCHNVMRASGEWLSSVLYLDVPWPLFFIICSLPVWVTQLLA